MRSSPASHRTLVAVTTLAAVFGLSTACGSSSSTGTQNGDAGANGMSSSSGSGSGSGGSSSGSSSGAGGSGSSSSGNPSMDAASSNCDAVGSATVDGTLQGQSFVAMDAVSYSGHTSGQVVTTVAVVDFSDLCAFGLSNGKANATYLYFSFTGPLSLGPIDIGAALNVQAIIEDQTCNSLSPVGNSGSVTLTRIDSCGVAGTFDITFTTDHLTGSFNAPTCTMPGDGGCN